MKPKPHHVPDFELWEEVARSVKPLRIRAKPQPKSQSPPPSPVAAPKPHVSAPAHRARQVRHDPPPLTAFDRRTAQKFTRGNVEIDARLDLHGMGIELARIRLLDFVHRARAEGASVVLVITGKGDSPFSRHTLHGTSHFHVPEREGRLRRLVPDWLHEAEFRAHVSGFQPAHPKHGGGGAFYVKLRRVRSNLG
jgi:DNA-nicking Smr family endonuclease